MFLPIALAVLSQTTDIRFEIAITDEQLNQTFNSQQGWIGADGVFSVPIGKTTSWWLFSDTWIGKIKDGSRVDATIVNNTAARLDGKTLKFIVKKAKDGKAQALITPKDGKGWLWLGSSALIDRKLHIFLSQIVKTDDSSTFGFKPTAQWLGVGKNLSLDPTTWEFDQRKIPFSKYDDKREISFGFSLCQVGSWLYIYGTDEDILPSWKDRYLTVARCKDKQISKFDTWEFWTGKGWSKDSSACARTVNHMASDGSVSYLSKLKRFILVYTEDGLSPRILVRTAKAAEGPWSEPTEVYNCPEGAEKGVYCYQAKNHPELANGNELVISYCTNSFDFWQSVRDAKIYFPRFIRVAIESE